MSRCSVTRVQLAGCYKIACARRRITKLTPTIKCTSASVIQTNGVEVMHVWGKRMRDPLSTQDFKTVQSENPGILGDVPCLHFWEG